MPDRWTILTIALGVFVALHFVLPVGWRLTVGGF